MKYLTFAYLLILNLTTSGCFLLTQLDDGDKVKNVIDDWIYWRELQGRHFEDDSSDYRIPVFNRLDCQFGNNGLLAELIIADITETFKKDMEKSIGQLTNSKKNSITTARKLFSNAAGIFPNVTYATIDKVDSSINSIYTDLGDEFARVQKVEGKIQKYDSLGEYKIWITGSGSAFNDNGKKRSIHLIVDGVDVIHKIRTNASTDTLYVSHSKIKNSFKELEGAKYINANLQVVFQVPKKSLFGSEFEEDTLKLPLNILFLSGAIGKISFGAYSYDTTWTRTQDEPNYILSVPCSGNDCHKIYDIYSTQSDGPGFIVDTAWWTLTEDNPGGNVFNTISISPLKKSSVTFTIDSHTNPVGYNFIVVWKYPVLVDNPHDYIKTIRLNDISQIEIPIGPDDADSVLYFHVRLLFGEYTKGHIGDDFLGNVLKCSKSIKNNMKIYDYKVDWDCLLKRFD